MQAKKDPVTRFYQVRLPSPNIEWARIWITDDGCFSTVSDYGNYGYWWGAPGCEFREFLCRISDDYLITKLADGETVYDGDGTLRAVKRYIIDRRREHGWTRAQARHEWDLLGEFGDLDSQHEWSLWSTETSLPIYESEFLVYRAPRQVVAFVEQLWPLFVEALRAELAAERRAASA